MEISALLTFIVIAGVVWGGFVGFAAYAIRRESIKTNDSANGF